MWRSGIHLVYRAIAKFGKVPTPVTHTFLEKRTRTYEMAAKNSTSSAASGKVPHQCLSWTVNETALFFLGLAGAAGALALWLSPVRDVWTGKESVWASKSTARVATGFPYVTAVYNCLLWLLYSAKNPAEFLVPIFVNFAGLLLNASFTWCFWKFSEPGMQWWVQVELAGFAVYTAIAIALWFALSIEAVGWMAVGVNALMLFSPLAAARQVVRMRSTQGMPFLPLLFTLLSSIVWFSYGLYICNAQVMAPNGLGVVFGTVQLALFAWVKQLERSASRNEDVEGLHEVPSRTEFTDRESQRELRNNDEEGKAMGVTGKVAWA